VYNTNTYDDIHYILHPFYRASVLQCVAVCCSVLQCVAVCCSVLQCVAVCCSERALYVSLVTRRMSETRKVSAIMSVTRLTYRALLWIYRALLWIYRALLWIYRALLWIYRALLWIYRALLCIVVIHRIMRSSVHIWVQWSVHTWGCSMCSWYTLMFVLYSHICTLHHIHICAHHNTNTHINKKEKHKTIIHPYMYMSSHSHMCPSQYEHTHKQTRKTRNYYTLIYVHFIAFTYVPITIRTHT